MPYLDSDAAREDERIIGLTVARISYGCVPGAFGDETAKVLHFTDGSFTFVVMPGEGD
jgi:hypothetical protein